MSLPKKFYRVVLRTPKQGKLRMYEKGGGTYVRGADAKAQVDRLAKKGIACDLYESEPVVWKLIEQ